jgi:hypothetical protein
VEVSAVIAQLMANAETRGGWWSSWPARSRRAHASPIDTVLDTALITRSRRARSGAAGEARRICARTLAVSVEAGDPLRADAEAVEREAGRLRAERRHQPSRRQRSAEVTASTSSWRRPPRPMRRTRSTSSISGSGR